MLFQQYAYFLALENIIKWPSRNVTLHPQWGCHQQSKRMLYLRTHMGSGFPHLWGPSILCCPWRRHFACQPPSAQRWLMSCMFFYRGDPLSHLVLFLLIYKPFNVKWSSGPCFYFPRDIRTLPSKLVQYHGSITEGPKNKSHFRGLSWRFNMS